MVLQAEAEKTAAILTSRSYRKKQLIQEAEGEATGNLRMYRQANCGRYQII